MPPDRPASLRIFPDPILRGKARPVTKIDAGVLRTIRLLEVTMRHQPHGIGIAAPQIGVSKRIAVVDVSERVAGAGRMTLINPIIVKAWEERPSREGCMSLPDYTAVIKRYHRVLVKWIDEAGKTREKLCEGIEAVCLQHEIDHLDGTLYIDHVISLKRDMIPRVPRKNSPLQ